MRLDKCADKAAEVVTVKGIRGLLERITMVERPKISNKK